MKQLSDYKVTFRRDAMFGAWHWTAQAPDGDTLHGPLFGLMLKKESAERDAARRIKFHAETETVDGRGLIDRLPAST